MTQSVSVIVEGTPYYGTLHSNRESSNAVVFYEDFARPLPEKVTDAFIEQIRKNLHLSNPQRLTITRRLQGCIYFNLPPN